MRIAVSGTGLLCSTGLAREPAFAAMLAGDRGLPGPISGFDANEFLGARGIRHFDRTAQLLASAATEALRVGGLLGAGYDRNEIGIVVGATHGSIQAITEFDQEALREGPRYVNPQAFCNTVMNAPAGRLAIRFGITGVNTTVSSGVASSLDAIAYAMGMLATEQIAAAICGSALGHSNEVELGYRRAGRLVDAADVAAPFGAKRRGAALGEGAAVLVLEREDAVLRRRAAPLALLSGAAAAFAPNSDAAATAEALETAMRTALAQAGVAPDALSAIVASASGSPAGDACEARALRSLLGDAAARIPIAAPKAATNECLEASGAIGLVTAVSAILASRVPPIAGLTDPDPDFAPLDFVIGASRHALLDHVLVIARDDEGHCAAAVVSRP